MVTLTGIINTIKTTSNFWDAVVLKSGADKKVIKFRNGILIEVNASEYGLLRDWLLDLSKNNFNIQQTTDGYLIKNIPLKSTFNFKTHALIADKSFLDFLLDLILKGWIVENSENKYKVKKERSVCFIEYRSDKLFNIKTNKIDIVGPEPILYVHFHESEAGLYQYNYKDKTVLDIGGFCGETAAYFSGEKAKKVIVYEPVHEHQEYIKRNAEANNINIELHDSGIGKSDSELLVNYDAADLGFGFAGTGKNQTIVKIRNVTDVIAQSKADIAKIDCEGAETSLLDVDPAVLGLINTYFIETHSSSIREAIIGKFYDSGFIMEREPIDLSDGIAMLYFKKK